METINIYVSFESSMGELEAHQDVYEEVIGKYGKEQQEEMIEFFIKGCRNFARHPQDVLNEMERDLK